MAPQTSSKPTNRSTSSTERAASSTSFSNKSNLTAKQREQIKDVPLVGQNPGNVTIDAKERLRADTELLGGNQAAQRKFTELTGETVPTGIKEFNGELPNGGKVYYRKLGDSGHSKLEITQILSDGKTVLEKITFK